MYSNTSATCSKTQITGELVGLSLKYLSLKYLSLKYLSLKYFSDLDLFLRTQGFGGWFEPDQIPLNYCGNRRSCNNLDPLMLAWAWIPY